MGSSNSICAAGSVRTVLRTASFRTSGFGLRLGLVGRDAASRFRLALSPSCPMFARVSCTPSTA